MKLLNLDRLKNKAKYAHFVLKKLRIYMQNNKKKKQEGKVLPRKMCYFDYTKFAT